MNSKRILGYVGNQTVVTEKDAKQLTNINFAFGQLTAEGKIEVDHLDIFSKMDEIRNWNPNIKIVVSIVPKTPDAFTVCCASQELREKTAESCAEMVTKYHFDGVDFDWEYPTVPSNGSDCYPEDRHNFTLLCAECRKSLDAVGEGNLLTIAAGADLYYVHCVELPELMAYLDYICLMTYDLKCGFHALAGHHTQLFSSTGDVFRNSCAQALELFHKNGVPKEKLLMGAAFYSRKWENISERNHGLLQICKNGGGYGPGFTDLQASYINKGGYVRYWDDEAKAPWLFDGSTFLSYDDEQSLELKSKHVVDEDYGGIFYWEHRCDTTGTLLNCIYESITKYSNDKK